LHKNKAALFVFYFTSLSITGFLYCFPLVAGVRYFGIIYVAFLVALWIQKSSRYDFAVIYPEKINKSLSLLQRLVTKPFIILLFSSQMISSCIMYYTDYTRPFSDAKEAAAFISGNHMADSTLAVSNAACISALGGYLGKTMYSPEAGRYCAFSPWDANPFQFKEQQLIDAMKLKQLPYYERATLATNHALHFQPGIHPEAFSYQDEQLKIYPVAHFTKGVVSSEHYFIYRIIRKKN
jgi:hypothetical protein